MMKKSIFLIPLLLHFTLSYAQYKGGLEAGANIMGADFTIDEPIDTKYSWGIRLGYVGEYHFSEHLYLRGAALINQRGLQYADERWGLNAFDVPVNIGYQAGLGEGGLKVFFDAGFNLEYNFRAFTKINDELVKLTIGSETDDIKSFSTGFNAGTGLQFSEKVKVRINYYQGLTNLVRTSGDEWKNHVFGLALNYFF